MKYKLRLTAALLIGLLAIGLSGCGAQKHENVDQGMALIEELKYEDALNAFDAAVLNKEDPQLTSRGQGIAYIGLTDYTAAADALERALSYSDADLSQIDYDINYYLATAYFRLGDLDKAQKVYEAITALRPKEKTAYYLKGVMELAKHQNAEAQADFDKAVSIAPNDYDMRIDIFCSCADYGQRDMGQTYLQEVLDADSKKLTDYNRGRMNYYLGDYASARNSLEKARETQPTAEVVGMLGQTYEKLGDYNYAASVYINYLNNNQDALIFNQLGLCQLQMGNYQDALDAFQRGLNMEGGSLVQTLKYNQIVAYEYLGEFQQANVLMKQYLAAYPDDTKAQREAKFLQTR